MWYVNYPPVLDEAESKEVAETAVTPLPFENNMPALENLQFALDEYTHEIQACKRVSFLRIFENVF